MTTRRGLDTSILDDIGVTTPPPTPTPQPSQQSPALPEHRQPAPTQPPRSQPADSDLVRISFDLPRTTRTALKQYALANDTNVVTLLRAHVDHLLSSQPHR